MIDMRATPLSRRLVVIVYVALSGSMLTADAPGTRRVWRQKKPRPEAHMTSPGTAALRRGPSLDRTLAHKHQRPGNVRYKRRAKWIFGSIIKLNQRVRRKLRFAAAVLIRGPESN